MNVNKLTVNIPSELYFEMKRKIDFLQEQSEADRVQIETLQTEKTIMCEALSFYAEHSSYEYPVSPLDGAVDRYAGTPASHDRGKRARDALSKVKVDE